MTARLLALAAAAFVTSGCGKHVKIPDACAGYGGKSCISLEVQGAFQIDQVTLTTSTALLLGGSDSATSPSPAGASFKLPVVLAIVPDPALSGAFDLTVEGLLHGSTVGSAATSGNLTPGQHLTMSVTLQSGGEPDLGEPDGGDGGSGDMGPVDVAAPTPVTPHSTSIVTSRKPKFRFILASGSDGARIEICPNRACATPTATQDVVGSSATWSGADLPASKVIFWRLRGMVGGAAGATTSAVWEFTTGKLDAPVVTSWGTVLDVNGDGFSDMFGGAPQAVTTGMPAVNGPGRAYVFHGSASWRVGLPSPASTLVEPAGQINDDFGQVLASAGDVNGDGFADFIVGAPFAPTSANGATNGPGRAYVYHGSISGLGIAPMPATILKEPTGASTQETFGLVGAAGDVDGDGYGDVLVASEIEGKIYVYRGSPTGLGTTPTWVLQSDSSMHTFDQAPTTAGDLNGDGYDDIVASDSLDGIVYIYYGGPTKFTTTAINLAPDAMITGPSGSSFGSAVSPAGDVNGDGYGDLLIGAQSAGASSDGGAFVYFGSSAGIVTAQSPASLVEPTPGNGGDDLFGRTLGGGGDIDGDGLADVVIGASGAFSAGETNGPGYVFVYLGKNIKPGNVTLFTALQSVTPTAGDGFGWSTRSLSDFDGDGFADVSVGAFAANNQAGSFSVFFGLAGGFQTSPTSATAASTVIGPDLGSGHFAY